TTGGGGVAAVVRAAPGDCGARAGVGVRARPRPPSYPRGVGPGTAPSTVPPAPADILEPIPSARPGTQPGGSAPSGSSSANPRTGFYPGPSGSRLAARRVPALARSPNTAAAPEPTRRSAQERSTSAGRPTPRS